MAVTIDANPMRADLKLYRGDDFFVEISVLTPEGEPADLDTTMATAQIRETPTADIVLADFLVTTIDNVITLHLPAADTVDLPNAAVWDVQIEWSDATVTTLVAGKVLVTDEVTR